MKRTAIMSMTILAMATAYIPRPDAAFDGWQTNFVGYVAAHWGDLGLSSDVVTMLTVAGDDWAKQFGGHVAARAAATAAKTKKNASRAEFDKTGIGVVAVAGQHRAFVQFSVNEPVERRLRSLSGRLPPADEVTSAPPG